jgi:hypothetical protein
MIVNASQVIQHKRKSAITMIKSPTARRRRALLVCRRRLSTTFTHVVGPPLEDRYLFSRT